MLAERYDSAPPGLHTSFAAIGQIDIGEQLRAALTEGYSAAGADDEAPGASTEYEAEEPSTVQALEADTEAEAESEALERLARAGHWARCLAHAGRRAPHYALRYAAHLFKAHTRMENIDIDSEEPPEALSQALEALRQYLATDTSGISSNDMPLAKAVCSEILVRVSMVPRALTALKDAAAALTLLMALHVPQIAAKAARALPRYSNIIVGDVECTDWSQQPLLLDSGCIRGSLLDEM
ncbi:Ribosomal RNA large subunit methyltransferase H [Operophtera brumata]|uniref:Ribosomal RNA large subunit methyltransferase H n=1 Tax=Operophtera brumata TaxID=104452 RepID=A0A0L7LLA4_OPEBR|nr:Ribosomal RNA large subunit methyltransferase H [Operophtera brumata]